ncbi:Alpha/beta hydrolase family protein [Pseudoruegeria aquimaris]|uniref:Alpha/beta hydrolase family protein n=1 Tax=Pseudoruegeria aquimaris TaxID=393663 RepID=A0A1Y5S117_9RHOB|nr:alpha/beta fold hydrolase [Pseudoruegeria aquimaris]SLN30214.1 Alpha/beta hydrolase family protein [Pseudoruegeria aquimaris]
MSQSEADIAYANADFIPDAAAYPPRWEERAREWREVEHAVGRAQLNMPYGEGARQRFDLFYPAGRPEGLMVFVHGGYWRRFDNKLWSHFAAGAQAAGWAVAMPSYTLAPEARIAEITQEVRRAVEAAAARVAGPIVLTGHSAGGHLVARMLCPDVGLDPAVAARLKRVVPISPLADLVPLMETAMNADLRIDAAEAEAESPIRHSPLPCPVTVWVGAEERPAFLDQARWLTEAWEGAELRIDPGRHHFDVIDGLADDASPLMKAVLGG